MNKKIITLYLLTFLVGTLTYFVGESYNHFINTNECLTIESFSSLLISSIGFSIFVNAFINITNYYVQKKKKQS